MREDLHNGTSVSRLACNGKTLGVVPVGVNLTPVGGLGFGLRGVAAAVSTIAVTGVGCKDDLCSTLGLNNGKTDGVYD